MRWDFHLDGRKGVDPVPENTSIENERFWQIRSV